MGHNERRVGGRGKEAGGRAAPAGESTPARRGVRAGPRPCRRAPRWLGRAHAHLAALVVRVAAEACRGHRGLATAGRRVRGALPPPGGTVRPAAGGRQGRGRRQHGRALCSPSRWQHCGGAYGRRWTQPGSSCDAGQSVPLQRQQHVPPFAGSRRPGGGPTWAAVGAPCVSVADGAACAAAAGRPACCWAAVLPAGWAQDAWAEAPAAVGCACRHTGNAGGAVSIPATQTRS